MQVKLLIIEFHINETTHQESINLQKNPNRRGEIKISKVLNDQKKEPI